MAEKRFGLVQGTNVLADGPLRQIGLVGATFPAGRLESLSLAGAGLVPEAWNQGLESGRISLTESVTFIGSNGWKGPQFWVPVHSAIGGRVVTPPVSACREQACLWQVQPAGSPPEHGVYCPPAAHAR